MQIHPSLSTSVDHEASEEGGSSELPRAPNLGFIKEKVNIPWVQWYYTQVLISY